MLCIYSFESNLMMLVDAPHSLGWAGPPEPAGSDSNRGAVQSHIRPPPTESDLKQWICLANVVLH